MNRYLVIAFGLFLLCSSSAIAQTKRLQSGLHEAKVIRAGCEFDYPPYCFVSDAGMADGFSVELLRETLKIMGRSVEFKTGLWSELKDELKDGRLQVLPLVGRTPEREAMYDFSFPYLTMHGVIVVREDNKDIHTIADLKGKELAVLHGDNAEEYARRSSLGATIVTTPTSHQALRELSAGKHDAVIIQQLLFFQLLKQNQIQNLRVAGPPMDDFAQNFCFAVKSGDKKLLSLLNEGLAILIANGTFRRLNDKWFSSLASIGREKRTIIVGGDSKYPPYEFLDAKGNPAGYNVDLARAIAEQMGINIEFKLGNWSMVLKELKEGKIDIVPGLFYSAERDKSFDFSQAHTIVNHVVVIRKGDTEISNLRDLAGKTILVMDRDIMQDFAVEHGYGEHLIPVATIEEALSLLAQGKYDCALVPKVPAFFFIEKHAWKNLQVLDMTVLPSEYCFATAKDKGSLLAQFAEGLAAIKKTGKYREIYSKWLGVYEESKLWRIMKFGLAAFVILMLLFVISLILSRSLKGQVRAMTADLRRMNERLDLAVKSADLGVWDWYVQEDQLVWDEQMYKLYGLKKGEFDSVYESWVKGLHPEDSARVNEEIQKALNGEKEYNTGFRIVRPDGEIRHLRAFGNVTRDGSGRPLRMTGINYDISGRKQSEEDLQMAKDYAENLIQTANAMLVVLDKNGKIQVFNKTAEEITGYTAGEMIGRNWFEVLVPRGRYPQVWEEFERIMKGGVPKNFENPILTKSGEERYIMWQNSELRNMGASIEIISFGIDITQRKKAEDELRLSREKLEENNLILQDSVRRAKELAIQAESANKAKSEFLANMSHEIRTPMNAVIGFSELLMETELTEKQREYVNVITSRGGDLISIIRDILDLSRLEAGMLSLNEEDYDLPETVESAMKTVKFAADEKNLEMRFEFKSEIPQILKGDSLRIKQILINLLGNAVKFTEKGGVTLSVSALPPENDMPARVSFTVTDTGIGIHADKHQAIFEPFVQADGSHTRKYGGTGLGLSICKRLVDKMGGEISVKSEPGKGATFVFIIPLHEAAPEGPEKAADIQVVQKVKADASGLQILVVEDDYASMQLLDRILSEAGYTVVGAETGRMALEMASKQSFDMIIMDIQIPEINGVDATVAIRQLEAAGKLPQSAASGNRKRIPIVAFTAFAMPSDRERCLSSGMDDFMSKPIHKGQVLEMLSKWLHQEPRNTCT